MGLQPTFNLSNKKRKCNPGQLEGVEGEAGRETQSNGSSTMINGQFIGQILMLSKFYERLGVLPHGYVNLPSCFKNGTLC